MGKNISDQIIDFLTTLGIKRIYGIPGDTIDSMMESLRVQSAIEFIIMRHEEAGAFAASAEAKLTGNLAVVAACQGPGAIHLLNGLYDAKLDRVPVLAITGQVDTKLIGTQTVQEVNQLDLFNDCCVFNERVASAAAVPKLLALACEAAIRKRGVAHLAIPSDIMRDKIVDKREHTLALQASFTVQPDLHDIKVAAEVLNNAKRVTILYGDGARHAVEELEITAKKCQAPLVHTTRSKDILDNKHPHYVGGIGLMGTKTGCTAVYDCDALLIVGSNFAFEEFYPKNTPIIQIELDGSRLGERIPITHGIIGHSRVALSLLNEHLTQKDDMHHLDDMKKLQADVRKIFLKKADPKKNKKVIHPQALTEMISDLADDDAIFCADSGTASLWANSYLHLNGKQRYLWSWNLASLGFALPAALGCQLEEPDKQVIVLAGDGGFEMLIGDLATAIKYQLPIKFIVYNNSRYGFIELEEQITEGNPVFGTKFTNPDFANLAEAYGAEGYRICHYDEMESTLKKAFASDKTCIIDAFINPREFPIPPKISKEAALHFAQSQIKSWFGQKNES